jgi:ATP-dependent DNA helicase RecQ
MEKLIHILKRVPGCGIVYVRNRKLTRETAEWLNNHGISADFYHAGLTIADRSKKQEAWIKNKVRIMVATNAFGMGIDKPDVRVVVHIDLADSLEAYYQEAGRGGRDGNKAYAIVLYNQEDVQAAQFRLSYFNPTPTQVVQVYEALAHYFQIPLGSGVGESFDFNIGDFCQKFNQDPPVVLRAIQILEQHDYLTPSEAVFLPSRLRFLVDKSALYTFEIENKRSEPLIKCLLRNYPLFNGDFVEITESVIAAQLKITLPTLVQQLLQLQQFNIVEYLPKKNAPQLAFNQGRRATSSIAINAALLNEQMAKYQYRLNAVEQYVTSKTKCRSRILLAYFNEPISSNCGQCDYCLSLKKNALESAQFDLVISAIKTQFNDQSFTIAQLQHGLPNLTLDRINPILQWLLQENLLVKKEQGYYKPPNINF